MAYQAIYRKWRPLVFEDIIGQTHVTKALKNQIINNKISHAYLFSGTRGTGKTTAAKVFSRAVNCLNNTNGSPCNECEVCRGILEGSIFDITEIDAASNNRVEDIRNLIDDVGYSATQAKYRVYIIDEVHMLSNSAFNALLKTLEEPPEYVIFILATTEAHKVPETILSRCQRFDFKRIRPSDIMLRMKEITYADGIKISDEALEMIARMAEGSMRDGLSILERVVSASEGEISLGDAVAVLGTASSQTEFKMAEYVITADTKGILELVGDVMADGVDLNVFISGIIKHFRDLIVCKITDKPEDSLDCSADDAVKLKAQAAKTSYEGISHVISTLTKAAAEAKWVKSPRVIYELALIKSAKPELDDSKDALAARLARTEELIADMEQKIAEGVTVRVEEREAAEKTEEPKKAEKKNIPERLFKPIPESERHNKNPIVLAARKWDKISQAIFRAVPYLASVVIDRKITVDGEGILLLFERNEAMTKQIAAQHLKSIRAKFKTLSGVDCAVKLAFRDEVEDVMPDIWALPDPPEQKREEPVKEELAETEQDGGEKKNRTLSRDEEYDAFEEFLRKYPEIIELTDDSEFLDYDAKADNFVQSSLDDDGEEEFLDENEIKTVNNEE